MLNRLTTLWILGLFLTIPAYLSAQVLTAERHTPCFRDSLEVYKMPYTAVGDSGRNCVWDFSNLPVDSADIVSEDYYALSCIDSTRIGVHRERAHYYMLNDKDTLCITGYETSYTRMQYLSPIPLLHFPFAYGDSIVSVISGKGQYCHHIPLSIEGRTIVRADGFGRIKLPYITIDSVLRVYTETRYNEYSNMHNGVTEEKYQWYSPYCRYTLLEIVKIRTITNADTTYVASTYYLPQEQKNMPVHELKEPTTDEETICFLTDVSYLPNPVVSDLQIRYTLTRDANVYISLHYNGGATTFKTPIHGEPNGENSHSINMSGLPTGNYVVYVHADDTVVSGNIIKL